MFLIALIADKSKAAVDFMAKHFLKTLFPIRQRLIGANRAAYKKHLKSLSDALYEAKAGSHALDMVLANNSRWSQGVVGPYAF